MGNTKATGVAYDDPDFSDVSVSGTLTVAGNAISGTELGFLDGVTAGTAAASKAVVLNSSKGITTITSATITTVTSTTGNITTVNTGAIGASDSALAVTGAAAAQGGTVDLVGGTSSTAGNAGGAVTLTGGTPGSTGIGGAATIAAGVGGSASGNGGVASLTGGAGTAGNSTGGVGKTVGGAGQGTGAGGAAQLTGGASGAGATGNGGAATVAGGAAGSTNGNGGSVYLTPGALAGSGFAGQIIERGTKLVKQGAPTAKTVSATLTAAEILAGIITVNQAGAGASAQQLPTATDMDTGFPDAAAGDAFDFYLINTSTVDAEDASVTTNTGWTLVGSMDIHAYSAAGSLNSSAHFRARKTGAAAWTLYRLA